MVENGRKKVDSEIPFSFFFLFPKLKLSEITSDTTLDCKKLIDSYCALNDTFNSD